MHFCIYLERNSPNIYQNEKHFWQKLQWKMKHILYPICCSICMQVYYPVYWLSLQTESVAVGNDHFTNTSAVSCDEENVKVRNSSKFIRNYIETSLFWNTFFWQYTVCPTLMDRYVKGSLMYHLICTGGSLYLDAFVLLE